MDCAYLPPLLSSYADGSVSARERQIVETHLETCERCRDLVAAYETVAEQIRALRAGDRFPSVAGSVLDAAGLERRRAKVKPLSVGAGVAATTILLATGAVILNHRHRRRRAADLLPGVVLPS